MNHLSALTTTTTTTTAAAAAANSIDNVGDGGNGGVGADGSEVDKGKGSVTGLFSFLRGGGRGKAANDDDRIEACGKPTTSTRRNGDNSRLYSNADAKIRERRAWLSERHVESPEFNNLSGVGMWYMFTPVLPCPWTFEKQPSSDVLRDGGKWLCGLQEVHESRSVRHNKAHGNSYGVGKHYYPSSSPLACIVYSMGSNNDFTFEKRAREVAPGCEVHTFDPTSPETGSGKPYYDVYHDSYGFGGRDDNHEGPFPVKSIGTILRELHHDHVDYLKIDVEGYEFDFLHTVDWKVTRVGQILMEFHPFGKWSAITARDMNRIFTKLEDAGFYLISMEPVTKYNYAQVEVVFLHKDWRPDGCG